MKLPLKRPHTPRKKMEIGWRETVGLPDLAIPAIKAKIDTGARTCALHAIDIVPVVEDGVACVQFFLQDPMRDDYQIECIAPIHDHREIRNTSGVPEARYIIQTVLALGARHWHIELSLTNRADMGFDLIIGRTALRRHKIVVNPGKSFLAGLPGTKKKKKIKKISKKAGAKVAAERGTTL